MLRGFTPRLYQETILATAAIKNTLVVLPTGMGKTGIALLLAAQRLNQHSQSKILILAPTKPLAEQHLQTFKEAIDFPEEKFALFTGEIPPKKREQLWQTAQIIFSTPQGLENDIIGNKIDITKVSLLVFDEAHRATGDYSYVFIAKQYHRKAEWPRVLALTASPGSDTTKIEEVCNNLGIEAVEIRTEKDPDVQPYVQPIEIEWKKVELPEEFKKIQNLLQNCIKAKIQQLKKYGVKTNYLTKKELLQIQAQLQAKLRTEKDYEAMKAISLLAEIIKAQHAVELLETQSIASLNKYLTNLFEQAESSKIKAVKNLTADLSFKSAYILAQKLLEKNIEHPKIKETVEFITKEIQENKLIKIILFTQYRDTAVKLSEELNKQQGAIAKIFVGQAKKGETGLSQKQQAEMLDMFRDGMFNILIATSVAEEGLDIPKVDLVVFYEPIPSAIRHIQRRGRTGRQEKGRATIFLTKGTRDEAYSWSAKHKENRMIGVLEKMRKDITLKLAPKQPTLTNYDNNVKIFADYREKTTGTVKELVEKGVTVKLEMLQSADYILSARTGVELKTTEDFVNSIIDGRLLEQLKELKRNYEKPLIIIQGTQDLYSVRNVHANAIRGMLATIAISYGIPIISTKDEKDSAALLISIAKREQEENKKEFSPHADKKPMTIKEQQEYIVSALPNVGPNLAKELLKHFSSVQAVFMASEDGLKKVEGVGEKIAKVIKELTTQPYENERR
ncbi:DEAD/DEAH box helicase [Candidatus Woesearchaeota archaeon]|nr:DEAD/DEAH box helicase [Candidatus Woesearchaeota archaeon]MBW3016575.1 DEAD/DEAH box helicase [Candidatus Woesearchaeota archaeon]